MEELRIGQYPWTSRHHLAACLDGENQKVAIVLVNWVIEKLLNLALIFITNDTPVYFWDFAYILTFL